MKAAEYGTYTNAVAAFVSTNSICQGQQVPILWPLIFATKHEIAFAHTSFKWTNLASHNAGVTVAIVGISNHAGRTRQLFSTIEGNSVIVKEVDNINAYLVAAQNVIVDKSTVPLSGQTGLDYGNKPTDDGGLLLSPVDYREMITRAPDATRFVKRFIGSSDSIDGSLRYCLWINDSEIDLANNIEIIAARLLKVHDFRASSTKPATIEAAKWSHKFQEIRQAGREISVVVPRHSSENRENLPFSLAEKGSIVADSAFAFYDAPWWNVALFASRLHLVWIATVFGKIKTDYRYSNTLGWNTFPLPPLTEKNKVDLTRCAEDILLAREAHFPATIADLYNPENMPENLRHAHERNDEVLERIYIGRRFKNDTERLEKLFDLYAKMTDDKNKTSSRKLKGAKT